ncbi:uncharacterized [Tachysurus ichikawai]
MHLCSVKGISTLCSPAAGRVQREDPCTRYLEEEEEEEEEKRREVDDGQGAECEQSHLLRFYLMHHGAEASEASPQARSTWLI